ncbi:MAG: LON peptidase substrate-binding domain-containing protein, partial [Gemmatimonadota bacterium]
MVLLMVDRQRFPVLPLRETVVFPGVAVPISAGRAGTVEAIHQALEGDRRMFAVCQRENLDEPSPDVLYGMGVVVKIVQTQRVRGGLQLLVQAERRASALAYEPAGEAMFEATVVSVDEIAPADPEDGALNALDAELRERAVELGQRRGIPSEALNHLVQGVEDPGGFADVVAFYLEVPTQEKQDLLETIADEDRMRKVLVAVERDLLRLDAQEEIQQRVQEELGDKQREMVLREQLKAIKKELNEDEEVDEVEALRERIAELELPDEAREEVERELNRLERTHPQSAEYQVIRTYLDWISELPWSDRTEDKIDLGAAEGVLHEDHYGLEDVKDRVLEFLAVRKLQLERAGDGDGDGEAESSTAHAAEGEGEGEGDDIDAAADMASDHLPGEADSGESDADADTDAEEADHAKAQAVGRGPILLFV